MSDKVKFELSVITLLLLQLFLWLILFLGVCWSKLALDPNIQVRPSSPATNITNTVGH